ncbi:MAG: hypothetical protein DSO07_09905 [Thermoproteota archaeon]|jgi:Translation elongation factor EF-1beta|uniref:Elongation factor 1-beta n=2 Tax=Candidatus Methanodesulfokora washburnensis TaxID=2478471 RepID=A0A429GI99_9CREN|nr:hypothetical protein D6D85_10030 [Candidatus Methanodesulfokores washburnensis]RZN58193.1 MAG: hypothetical protein EF810_07880 [Candidatus Methanodesulfokores washburnensis]TDA39859.1 MAG: hypothetical protein DSO07_09905 [Candidatus Korarchaeota archaeon]
MPSLWIQRTLRVIFMGKLGLVFRAILDGERKPSDIVEELKKRFGEFGVEVADYREEPIGFGVSQLELFLVGPDKEEISDKVEQILGEVKGISSFELDRISRV